MTSSYYHCIFTHASSVFQLVCVCVFMIKKSMHFFLYIFYLNFQICVRVHVHGEAGSASERVCERELGGGVEEKKIGHPLKQKARSQHRNRLLNFHWPACLYGNRLTLRQ